VLEELAVAPVLRIAVLQPEDRRGDVGRDDSIYGAYTGFSLLAGMKILTAS
jgi:hypothetical protein